MGYIRKDLNAIELYLTEYGKRKLIEKGITSVRFFTLGDSDMDYGRFVGLGCTNLLTGEATDTLSPLCSLSGGPTNKSATIPDISGSKCEECLGNTLAKEFKYKILYNKCE